MITFRSKKPIITTPFKPSTVFTAASDNSSSIPPLKYEMLSDFFNAMISSIRLFQLKRIPATFTKLATKIESLTRRRFTLHHLAQLKYIIPEVIVVKKGRVQSENTKCMQEELLVSLEMDAVEIDKNVKDGGRYSQLKNMFRSRLVDFSRTHQEDNDIPEGELSYLFHQPNHEQEPNSDKTPSLLVGSHITPLFKRQFSSNPIGCQAFKVTPANPSSCKLESPIKEATSSEAIDGYSSSAVGADEAFSLASTPAKLASVPDELTSTPSEFAWTPARLMVDKAAGCTLKRTHMTLDYDTCEVMNKSAKRLKFDDSSVDTEDKFNQGDEEESILPAEVTLNSRDGVLEVLPEDLLQLSIEKDRKVLEEKDPSVSQSIRRQQMIAGVPKVLNMVRLLFQSIQCTVITKEELVYKLLSGYMDIVDRVEIEEQLKLLQEFAPEYISEQTSLSGDTLLSLNKYAYPDSMCAKMLQAS